MIKVGFIFNHEVHGGRTFNWRRNRDRIQSTQRHFKPSVILRHSLCCNVVVTTSISTPCIAYSACYQSSVFLKLHYFTVPYVAPFHTGEGGGVEIEGFCSSLSRKWRGGVDLECESYKRGGGMEGLQHIFSGFLIMSLTVMKLPLLNTNI